MQKTRRNAAVEAIDRVIGDIKKFYPRDIFTENFAHRAIGLLSSLALALKKDDSVSGFSAPLGGLEEEIRNSLDGQGNGQYKNLHDILKSFKRENSGYQSVQVAQKIIEKGVVSTPMPTPTHTERLGSGPHPNKSQILLREFDNVDVELKKNFFNMVESIVLTKILLGYGKNLSRDYCNTLRSSIPEQVDALKNGVRKTIENSFSGYVNCVEEKTTKLLAQTEPYEFFSKELTLLHSIDERRSQIIDRSLSGQVRNGYGINHTSKKKNHENFVQQEGALSDRQQAVGGVQAAIKERLLRMLEKSSIDTSNIDIPRFLSSITNIRTFKPVTFNNSKNQKPGGTSRSL